MFGKIHQLSHLVLGFCCWQWQVFDYCPVSFVTGLFSLFPHDSVLVGCIFLGIYSFAPSCSICWCILVHNGPLQHIYFCGVSCNVFSSTSHFLCVFISQTVQLKVCQFLCVFSKITSQFYHIFLTVFMFPISFISALIFIISYF